MSTFVVLWHPSWNLSTANSGVPAGQSNGGISLGDHVVILEADPKPGIVAMGTAESDSYKSARGSGPHGHDYWADVQWEAWLEDDNRLEVASDWPVAAVDFNWHAVHGGPVRLSEREAASILSTWRAKVPEPPNSEELAKPSNTDAPVFVVFWDPDWKLGVRPSLVGTGGRKRGIEAGDRLVVVTRGAGRGMIAHGSARSSIYQGAHHTDSNKEGNWVDAEWDEWLENDDVLALQKMAEETLDINWFTIQGGGIKLSERDGEALMGAWRKHLRKQVDSPDSRLAGQSEAATVRVDFNRPVEHRDLHGVGLISASRHYLRASSVRQDHKTTVFLSTFGEVIAEWPTDQIVKVRWLEPTRGEVNAEPVVPSGDDPEQRAGEPWSDAEIADVAAAFRSGASVNQIAAQHKRTSGAIRSRLRKLDELPDDVDIASTQTETAPKTPAPKLWTELEITEVVSMFRSGSSLREIADWQASTISEVRRLLEEGGEWPAAATPTSELESDARVAQPKDIHQTQAPLSATAEPQFVPEPKEPDQSSKTSTPTAGAPDRFEEEALGHLRALTGRPDAKFREGQVAAIRAAVEKRQRVVVVQRTGWGKSAVYFIATRMLRERGLGPTLLLSPLIALMDNQVDAARKMGLRAEVINSTNAHDWDGIRKRLAADEIDLLLISEMRLANDKFRESFLPSLADRTGLLVVDEVHCISDWGHDFRPNYRRIGRVLARLPATTPVIGCTATANDRVVADVEAQFGSGITTVRGPLARAGLHLEVHTDRQSTDERLAWLAENVPQFDGAGIVYCLTRSSVFQVADFLEEHGLTCGRYVGGGSPNEIAAKQAELQRFLGNKLKCMVATSALGMGYDKADVGWVVHFQMPQSPIAYYQQVGRAGRDLPKSYGVLLAGSEDKGIQDWFIKQAFPLPAEVDQILTELEASDNGLSEGQLAARSNLTNSRVNSLMVQLDVEGVVERTSGRWYRTLAPWTYPHQRVKAVNAWRRQEQEAMEHYLEGTSCRMLFLREQLDDLPAERCGICDVCRGERFGTEPQSGLVQKADDLLFKAHVEIQPRKKWPSHSQGVTPIAEDWRLETGWCLNSWGSNGWGPLVKRGKQTENRFSDDLLEPVAEMIRNHVHSVPEWLTFVPSKRSPELVADFARRLAAHLNLPLLDLVTKTEDRKPQKLMQNSTTQHANVRDAFAIAGTPPPATGILFDDVIDSRWTVTVIGAALRAAGSGPVIPIGLASAAGLT